jgi:hypothetical protein
LCFVAVTTTDRERNIALTVAISDHGNPPPARTTLPLAPALETESQLMQLLSDLQLISFLFPHFSHFLHVVAPWRHSSLPDFFLTSFQYGGQRGSELVLGGSRLKVRFIFGLHTPALSLNTLPTQFYAS